MSISTELTNYSTYLTNAYNKCNDKGATMPQNKNLQNLTSCIDSISGGGSNPFEENFPNVQNGLLYALTSQPQINFPSTNTTCYGLFQYCFAIPSLNVSGYNTTNVTNMQNMFLSCKSATSITFGGSFTTASVTSMQGMFQYCQNLASLDLSTFNTANVTNMSNMFNLYNSTSANSNFTKLTSITFGNSFNTEKVTSMQGMFQVCDLLPSVDLSKFSAIKCSNLSYMFTSCNKMTSIDVHYLANNINTTKRTSLSL